MFNGLDFNSNIDTLARSVPLERLYWQAIEPFGVNVYVRRDDLIDKHLSGNKFYKLYGFIQDYKQTRSVYPIASFGGAYSNHLYALAAAGNALKVPTVGIVRGERPAVLSPTLTDCQSMGMRLHFVTRAQYKKRHDECWLTQLDAELGEPHYWVPEGGGGSKGRLGAQSLGTACSQQVIDQLSDAYTYIYLACGTATTFCGLVDGIASNNIEVVGVPVLKVSQPYVDEVVSTLQHSRAKWHLNLTDGHCGGYAKFPSYLQAFMAQFERETTLLVEPVYTAKVFYALYQQIKHKNIERGCNVIVIHSGGLQGRRGFLNTAEVNP